jgi:hypothetical protein
MQFLLRKYVCKMKSKKITTVKKKKILDFRFGSDDLSINKSGK